MKIIAISDTHGRHKKLKKRMWGQMPEGDVMVCAGDITPRGEIPHIMSFINFMSRCPCKHKIVIAGNHDYCFENSDAFLVKDEMKRKGIIYLQEQAIKIAGVKFYGSPWQPEFCNWAFNLPRGEALKEKWDKIPDDTDVLITHGPPHGILDVSAYDQGHYGCEELRDAIFNRVKPQAHIFGHFHLENGIVNEKDILFVNATSCDESYQIANDPVEIDVPDNGNMDEVDYC